MSPPQMGAAGNGDQAAGAPATPAKTGRSAPVGRPIISTGAALIASALIVMMGIGFCTTRMIPSFRARNETKVSHEMVVSQIRAVAKLVSSEATVRDVVTYENTWYGSTKHSLVVVTGKLTAGIDLKDSSEVSIDHAAKKIRITIPPARLLGVEVLEMKTYDERGGLWNPFKPADRDAIQRRVRAQLSAAGQQTELLRHANDSAAEMLRMLLAKDGYTVDVHTRGTPRGPFLN
ncbi:MAG TPA: DUF4230 domain-containing protein [Gemmatimonadaceae bacterium]|nr:DUF4230 domain-containing protein [Gemmatimonadaceae bacterium]